MSPERWRRIEELFHQALEVDAGERPRFLSNVCGTDSDLEREVGKLIGNLQRADDFLETSAVERLAGTAALAEPDRIGPYRMIRLIGRGGMGAVYLAARADDEYRKEVAIKLIRRGLDLDSVIRRFRHERQILANLDHPNIARLLDGGTTEDGSPYIVMEYIAGESIGAYCERCALSMRDRLGLFRTVCAAVHYAHQRLVVHLDIKPGNILVTGEGVPKLLDFGIARLLDGTAGAAPGDTTGLLRPMTPDYASPEQLRGEPANIASDIYSLGVLLYELLTGRRPSGDRNAGTLAGMDRDLYKIVLMAMHPDPQRRYNSVAGLSDDLGRYLAGRPVLARRDTLHYRTQKFLRRHKTGAAAAALLLGTLIGGFVSTAWQARNAAIQRARAQAAQARAERRLDDFLKLTHALLFEYHDAIAGLNGSMAVRLRLVRDTIDYLDEMAHEAGDSVPLQRQLAAAYLKIGDLQGKPYTANLGDTAGALFSYRRAVALLEPLVKANPTDENLRSELSGAYSAVGQLLTRMLDFPNAIDYLNRARHIRQQIAAAHPKNLDYARDLATIWIALGDPLVYSSNYRSALDAYSRAEKIRRAVVRASPADPAFEREWATSRQRLGAAYEDAGEFLMMDLGDPADARKAWRKAVENDRGALDLAEKVTAADPRNPRFRRTVADASSDTARNLGSVGEIAKALEYQRRAVAIFTALSDADPANRESRFDLLCARDELAALLAKAGQTDVAIRQYEADIAAALWLSRADPGNYEIKQHVRGAHHFLIALLASTGHPASAVRYARERLQLDESSAAADTSAGGWREDVAEDCIAIANVLARSGRPAEARTWALRGLAAARRSADRPAADAGDLYGYATLLLTCHPKDLRAPATAVLYLKRSLIRFPSQDPHMLALLGRAYALAGSREKAFSALLSAAALLPYPPAARDPAAIRRDIEAFARDYAN